MKGFGSHKKSKNKKIKNLKKDNLKEQIIYKALKSHSEGNIAEATKYYRSFIKKGFKDFKMFSNYGFILIGLGKLKEAELSYRKAIALKPDFAEAYLNLGNILNNIGKLKEAELSFRKVIELKPDFAVAHYNLGNILNSIGELKEAELSFRRAIELKPNFVDANMNLGNILKSIGKLKEAELSFRKAIELKPNYGEAHSNLGNVLKDLGQLKEAEVSLNKAIELKPDFAKAYYSLSLLKYSNKNRIWQRQLFSQNILNNKLKKEEIDIYFARGNVLHNEKNYEGSSKYYQLANDHKLNLNPSDSSSLINKSNTLLIESDKYEIKKKKQKSSYESIFIVGMFRSGSTLLESILSMRNDVFDLGEINILEESFLEYKKCQKEINLSELYKEKINTLTDFNNTTNKWLNNYQYAGIISKHIPNAKIIHCYRNPLDNILSIYRAQFAKENKYSSSIVDTTKVYLNQEDLMTQYKNKFRSKIYDLNYDLLVSNPNQEIKSLISWLGWKWEDKYLSPHLNPRSVSTASSVQVRSPINSKSIGGWKNYKDMMKPAIEILTQTERYKDLL